MYTCKCATSRLQKQQKISWRKGRGVSKAVRSRGALWPASVANPERGAVLGAVRAPVIEPCRAYVGALEAELRQKLEADVGLSFDGLYAHDLQGRATAFSKLIAGGLPVQDALVTSRLIGATGE